MAHPKMNLSSTWKKWNLQIAFGSAMVLLIFVAAFAYRSIVKSEESTAWVTNTRDVLKNIQLLRYSVESISLNIGRYLITGNESYLGFYHTNLMGIEQERASIGAALIKQDDNLKQIPTVILTTSESEADIVKSYELQANGYLCKPVELDRFESLVKSIDDYWVKKTRLPPLPQKNLSRFMNFENDSDFENDTETVAR